MVRQLSRLYKVERNISGRWEPQNWMPYIGARSPRNGWRTVSWVNKTSNYLCPSNSSELDQNNYASKNLAFFLVGCECNGSLAWRGQRDSTGVKMHALHIPWFADQHHSVTQVSTGCILGSSWAPLGWLYWSWALQGLLSSITFLGIIKSVPQDLRALHGSFPAQEKKERRKDKHEGLGCSCRPYLENKKIII